MEIRKLSGNELLLMVAITQHPGIFVIFKQLQQPSAITTYDADLYQTDAIAIKAPVVKFRGNKDRPSQRLPLPCSHEETLWRYDGIIVPSTLCETWQYCKHAFYLG